MRDSVMTARLAIHDMLDHIAKARTATSRMTFDAFVGSTLHRLAAERIIEIISEASRRIPDDLKATESEIPWPRVAGIGNVLRHDYQDVAPRAVWNVIENDLAELEAALHRMLAIIGDEE
jgi:uncharacterized protein with HEPN domain